MKIIISPSKTKVITGTPSGKIFNTSMTASLVHKLQQLTTEEIAKLLKLKEDKAQQVKEFYDHYDNMPTGEAIASYSGLAFKNLDWQRLSCEGKTFGHQHLVILSGLYGVVEPSSPMKDYRLDLVDPLLKSDNSNLYKYWADAVNAYFMEEDWILNVASQEYSKLITHPLMVSVEFQENRNGIWKQMSTTSKQMRGQLVHYLLENQISDLQDMPKRLGDFVLVTEIPKMLKEAFLLTYQKR